jgi:hypothetical protein
MRESIWSVSRRFRMMYSLVFMALFCAGCVIAIFEAGHVRDTEGGGLWHTYLDGMIMRVGSYSVAAAAAGVVLVEISEVVVMLSELLAERIARKRQERDERLREEGRQEERKKRASNLGYPRESVFPERLDADPEIGQTRAHDD